MRGIEQGSPGPAKVRDSYLSRGRGILTWLFSLDHKRIAVMYLAGVLLSFGIGSLLAAALRSQLLYPESTLISPAVFARLFSLHGAMMVFLVILPAIPAALGSFVLPLMLGAKNVALPRLNLAGFHLYLLGASLLGSAVITGGADAGWNFMPPYSLMTEGSLALTVLGAVVLCLSALLSSIVLFVTVQSLRPRGMGWFRMPIFAWSIYIESAVLILSLPILCGSLLLLLAERLGGFGLFSSLVGGSPLLFEQMFWFAAHPALYITLLPALGIIAEIFSTFTGRELAGYRSIVGSMMAIGVCSFLGWGIHLLAGDASHAAAAVTSFLAFIVAVPASLVMLNLVFQLRGGVIRMKSPLFLALASMVLLSVGVISSLFRALLPGALVVGGTAFEVGSLHYTILGGSFAAFLAGLHYWWPKIFGRVYREKSAIFAGRIAFLGFNLAFGCQLLLGMQGVPRRISSYSVDHYTHYTLQWLSSMGIFLLVAALFLVALYFRRSLSWPMTAPENPWDGKTLEWRTTSPPPTENFPSIPPRENTGAEMRGLAAREPVGAGS